MTQLEINAIICMVLALLHAGILWWAVGPHQPIARRTSSLLAMAAGGWHAAQLPALGVMFTLASATVWLAAYRMKRRWQTSIPLDD